MKHPTRPKPPVRGTEPVFAEVAVGIFPNRDAITRLVGAVLAEQSDEWAEGRRYFGLEVLARCRLASVDPGLESHAELPALESMEAAA